MKKQKIFSRFGKKVKLARKKAGLTQNQLAKALKYDTSQFVSNIERGLCAFPLKKFSRVAKVLKVDLEYLASTFVNEEFARIEKEIGL